MNQRNFSRPWISFIFYYKDSKKYQLYLIEFCDSHAYVEIVDFYNNYIFLTNNTGEKN